MLLTNNHFTPIIGIDIHFNTLPPFNPIHPYIGIVIDLMDYIPFIGSTVNVNNIPRGISDTGGRIVTFIHIPLFTGPFAMTPIIGHESMNFFGSQNAYIEGRRISPKGYMKMTCNDIGIPLSLSPGKKMKPIPSLFAPTSFSLPIPTGMPVNIAGPYVPDFMGILINLIAGYGFGALFKVLGKGMGKMLKALNKASRKATKGPNRLSKFLCKHGFEPVDLIQGSVLYEYVDFELPGPIPLVWERIWDSDSKRESQLGHGYHHSYDLPMLIDTEEQVIAVVLPDGRSCGFPILEDGQEFYNRTEKLTLKRTGNSYDLYHAKQRLNYHYTPVTDKYYVPVSISNTSGQAINLFYAGRTLVGLTDSCGRVLSFDTDYMGRITAIHLESLKGKSLLVAYEYNQEGDLVVIKDALLQPVTIQYDNHLMVAKTDRNGQSFYWEYDKQGRCIHTWGDGGLLEGWLEYHPELGYNIITDALGHQTTYYYNEDFLCTQVKDPLGNSEFFEYTDTFEMYREIDKEGYLTGYTYDERGNLTGVIQPDGAQYKYVYDENDRLIIANDPEGGSTIWNYDEGGNLYTTIAPDKGITAFSYNENGLVSEIRDVNKGITHLEYDREFNLVKMILPQGEVATWTYNEKGEVQKAVNPEGAAQKFSYDALGRVTQIINPDHTSVQLKYNAYNEVVHAKDNEHDVRFGYTPMGRLVMREENGVKIEFKYNRNEKLINIKNEHDEFYRFVRNANDEVIEEISFDEKRRKYHLDRNGRVLKVNKIDDKWTLYEYDAVGRVIRSEYQDGFWETFGYDKRGLLNEAVNPNITVRLIRDAMGRIISEAQGEHFVQSTYNRNGVRTAITSSLGAEITHQYNRTGQLIHTVAQTAQTEKGWEMRLQYDAVGQETLRTMTGDISSRWKYDDGGHPIMHSVQRKGGITRQRGYSWSAGNRLWRMVDELTGGETGYSYNAFGSLAWARYEDGQYDYKLPDEVGNLFKTKQRNDKEYGAGGKLLKDADYKYSYDAEGNLIAKNGKDDWKYEWLGNGMLKSVTNPDNLKVTFEYDALCRRTAKIVKDTIKRFVWDGNVLLHEWEYDYVEKPKWIVNDTGFVVQENPEPVSQDMITWVFEEGTFKPTAKIKGDKKYSIITDYLGTPCQAFDEQGEKVWDSELSIYGKIRKLEGEKDFVPFRYQGQYEDIETGLFYNRFRYYSPDTGSYISQDPMVLLTKRLYTYVGNSTTMVDILGLYPTWSSTALRWKDSVTGKFISRPTNLMVTKPDEAFFWSGRTNGIGGQHIAAEIAKDNNGTTLEMLIEKHQIKMPDWDASNPVNVKEWGKISEAYAQGASGNVRGVIGQDLRPGNIWETYEQDALKRNKNVKTITTIDPQTKAEKLIYTQKACP